MVRRYFTEDAEEKIRKAIDKLDNEVYSYPDVWMNPVTGRTEAHICLNYGTNNIPWRLEQWNSALTKYCEWFDIRNGEAIVLYNVYERFLEPLEPKSYDKKGGSKGKFEPFFKRKNGFKINWN